MAFCGDYTPEEDRKLLEMREQGFSWRQISAALGRHKKSLQNHITVVLKRRKEEAAGIPPKSRPWTAEDDERLFALRAEGLQWPEIGKRLGRTAAACSCRVKWLKRRKLQSEESAPEVEVRMSVTRETPAKLLPKTYWRKCHDCGKLTYNFRCDKCRAKWRLKHHVEEDEENQGGYGG